MLYTFCPKRAGFFEDWSVNVKVHGKFGQAGGGLFY